MSIAADLHIHSCLSPCGSEDMTPSNIVRMAALKGLSAIAVTDHNACANVAAAAKIAKDLGICLVPGAEITTREEVHVLCYFPELAALEDFIAHLLPYYPPLKNQPRFFGEQIIMNEDDEVIGSEDRLLLAACGRSIEQIERAAAERGGVMVPAHINKQKNSLLEVLGMIPADLITRTVEVVGSNPVPEAAGYRQIRSSDAHYLEHILEAEFFLETETCSPHGIVKLLGSSV